MATADAESPHVEKKRSFDAAFKLKVVPCAESATNRGAAAKFFCGREKCAGVEKAEG